jgi:dTDP-4-amino-4,6-dideoxygalactose transaminase
VCRSRIVERRRRNYAVLAARLLKIEGARALFPELPQGATPYVFPLYVEDPAASYQRLRSEGIPIFRWDEIWPGTPAIDGDHGLDWAQRVYQLGCHQDLSSSDVEAIAATVRACIRR